ncbi:Reverse transcriptase zinc-binding domain [Sesbania bispinosa]|nr:Reverse transcriptase zinc-binding domain [Sesbania bispinosa]
MQSHVSSTCPRGGEELTVADFIDASRGHWKVDMIRSFFSAADVNRILSIHLSRLDREDSLIWKLSKDDRYSVKSAYYHITENMVDNSHYRVQGDWKTLWKLKVPNCVKLFLWRLLRGCLPTRMNLQRKGVSCPATCAFCESALENEWHVFFGCMNNIACWQKAGMWQLLEQSVSVSEGFQETAFFLLSSLQYNMKHKFAMVLWSLWKQRNEKVWEGVQRATSEVVTRAQEAFIDWNCVKSCGEVGITSVVTSHNFCWFPPQAGRVSTSNLKSCTTMAPPPREAEALGLLDALSWLGELGMLEVDIELDCKEVVDALHGEAGSLNEFGQCWFVKKPMVEEAKMLACEEANGQSAVQHLGCESAPTPSEMRQKEWDSSSLPKREREGVEERRDAAVTSMSRRRSGSLLRPIASKIPEHNCVRVCLNDITVICCALYCWFLTIVFVTPNNDKTEPERI